MNNNDPQVKGELLGDDFHYHVLDVSGQPMIHVTRNRIAEIVLFGPARVAHSLGRQRRQRHHGHQPRRRPITVSKFSADDGDQKRTVSTRARRGDPGGGRIGRSLSRCRAGPARGQGLRRAASRFEVDALPEAGRAYDRVVEDERPTPRRTTPRRTAARRHDAGERIVKATPASPSPDLFYQKTSGAAPAGGDAADDPSRRPRFHVENQAEEGVFC